MVSAFMACMTAAWDGFVALGWRMLDAFAGLNCRALIGVCMLRSLEYGPRALLCVSLGGSTLSLLLCLGALDGDDSDAECR